MFRVFIETLSWVFLGMFGPILEGILGRNWDVYGNGVKFLQKSIINLRFYLHSFLFNFYTSIKLILDTIFSSTLGPNPLTFFNSLVLIKIYSRWAIRALID